LNLKKLLSVVLLTLTLLVIAACNSETQANPPQQQEPTVQNQAGTGTSATTPAPTPTPPPASTEYNAAGRDAFIAAQGGFFENTITGHLPIVRRRIHAGGSFTKIICDNDILWAAGLSERGRWGIGEGDGTLNRRDFQSDTFIPIMENVASVTSFQNGSYVLTNGGTLWRTGARNDTALVDLTPFGLDAFFQGYPVRFLDNIVDVCVTVGGGRSGNALALTSDGYVWAWSFDNAPTIVMGNVVYIRTVVADRAEDLAFFVITEAGDVYVWGQIALRRSGQSPARYTFSNPTRIEGIGELVNIRLDHRAITGVRTDGSAITIENAHVVSHSDDVFVVDPLVWTFDDRNAVLSLVVSQQGGDMISRLILSDNGRLQGDGQNSSGIINPDSTSSSFNGFQNIRTDLAYFAANGRRIIGIDFDGQIWGWGCNRNGELGLGFTSAREGFTQLNLGN